MPITSFVGCMKRQSNIKVKSVVGFLLLVVMLIGCQEEYDLNAVPNWPSLGLPTDANRPPYPNMPSYNKERDFNDIFRKIFPKPPSWFIPPEERKFEASGIRVEMPKMSCAMQGVSTLFKGI